MSEREYGCCRVCPITVEHWHYGERRPLGTTAPTPNLSTTEGEL